MFNEKFRPSSYPLITVDPFFSVWSFGDLLDKDYTRHWTGRPSPIFMTIYCGEERYYLCGVDENLVSRPSSRNRILQTNVTVTPLSTIYTFENDVLKVKVTFTSPLLLDDVKLFTRPVSYVEYSIEDKQNSGKEWHFCFGISSEICVNDKNQKVKFEKTPVSLRVGNTNQVPMSSSGEGILINWGYLHLCDKNATVMSSNKITWWGEVSEFLDMDKEYSAYSDKPYLAVDRAEMSGHITLGYDEVKPIEYFGTLLDEIYKEDFDSFEDMLECADREYALIKAKCQEFEREFDKKVSPFGDDYKNILTLSYRQAIAAHKCVKDTDGNILFLSFECYSAGCIATLDVTYPSMPLFLLYNPELVLGMLRPIVKYAESDRWRFPFTPHDVGWYPIVGEQVYGKNEERYQMPVEEIGNMLLCIAAIEKFGGNGKQYFDEHRKIMKTWAEYLEKFGYDPGEQLCTDDFAGHFNHNCNLSVKAILGLYAYGSLANDEKYINLAKEFAKNWEKDAKNNCGTRLTFDKEDTWSLKYNMVLDNLLGYNIFSEDVKKKEVELYKTKMNPYGVPLDNRKDYAKCDWMMWTTCLYNDKEYFDAVCESMARFISVTPDRAPFADWYDTKTAEGYLFRNRTVVGGLFINLLF